MIDVTGEIDPRNLLVSDAEREHVGQLLQRAVGQGRLTLDEFDTRMASAMAARTRGDLNVLVVDLAQPLGFPGTELAVRPGREELRLQGGVGDLSRRGPWVVPPTVTVTGGIGDTVLDFSEAEFTSPVTTVEATLGVGDLTIVVPPGASVDLDEAHCSIGEVKDKVSRYRPEPGMPHIVVRGTVRVGDIKVMNPRSWRIGPLTVHSPFRLTWGG